MTHKAGFVNILGRPNVGKSTLLNGLLDTDLVITSSKPQTTRHRIFGIDNTEDYQIVYSDTPGIMRDPAYAMQEIMNRWAFSVFEDADLLLLMVDPYEPPQLTEDLQKNLAKLSVPVFFILNKIDLKSNEEIETLAQEWEEQYDFTQSFRTSALKRMGLSELKKAILSYLPESPPYFPKEDVSDRPLRFFISEIIREKILEQYKQEIPYACQVEIESYKIEERPQGDLARIEAIIYVERKSQKGILIGHKASRLKKLGIAAREKIEAFLGHQVFLHLYVKVREDWRSDEVKLKRFGYR